MSNDKIKGMASMVLRRCSSKEQGTSIENQGKTVSGCIAVNELTIVGEVILDGVSGSVPGNRTDIDEIVARKRTKNDFTLLIVPDTSRFTRAGQGHGQKLIYDLRTAGIQVYFVAESLLIDCEAAEMYVSFLFAAANQHARAIARNTTNGNTHSFLAGRSPYTRRPPIGIDRVFSYENKDLFVLRNMLDGTQQMLDVETGELLRVFDKNPKRGVFNHYLKQKNEKVRLIPGSPERVAAVQMIFHLYHIEHMSIFNITKRLNTLEIPSPEGKDWHTVTTLATLRSPCYVGRGIRFRKNASVYFIGGESEATPAGTTIEELATAKFVKAKRRPRDQWKERPIPELVDFLPQNVRVLAEAHIQKYLDSIADGKPPKRTRDKHHQSLYLLKHLMRSIPGLHSMSGKLKGHGVNPTRYYAVMRGDNAPKSDSPLIRAIPAKPIEHAVLTHLREVLMDRPGLTDAMTRAVETVRKVQTNTDDVAQLRKELQRNSKQIALLADEVGFGDDDDDDPIFRKLTKLRIEKRKIEAQLRFLDSAPTQKVDSSTAIRQLTKRLEELVTNIEKVETPLLRSILQMFVTRLDADLVSKVVELELAVPSWVAEIVANGKDVGLEDMSLCKPFVEAHPEKRVILAEYRCFKSGHPACYTCQRKPKSEAA